MCAFRTRRFSQPLHVYIRESFRSFPGFSTILSRHNFQSSCSKHNPLEIETSWQQGAKDRHEGSDLRWIPVLHQTSSGILATMSQLAKCNSYPRILSSLSLLLVDPSNGRAVSVTPLPPPRVRRLSRFYIDIRFLLRLSNNNRRIIIHSSVSSISVPFLERMRKKFLGPIMTGVGGGIGRRRLVSNKSSGRGSKRATESFQ